MTNKKKKFLNIAGILFQASKDFLIDCTLGEKFHLVNEKLLTKKVIFLDYKRHLKEFVAEKDKIS